MAHKILSIPRVFFQMQLIFTLW